MIEKTEGIILKTFDFRETSKIAVFFSKDFGKIKGLLKGIRKDPRKFGSSLNLGSLNEIVFYRKRNSDLHLVSHCDLSCDFMPVRQHLKKSLALNYVLELVNVLMPQEDKNEPIFELMLNGIKSLETEKDISKLIHIFQIKTLAISGFKPHFDSCIICDRKISGSAYFSHRLGGLACLRCKDRDKDSHPVLRGTIATIRHVERQSFGRALKLGLNSSVRLELDKLLNNFLVFHLERSFKSPQYLQI